MFSFEAYPWWPCNAQPYSEWELGMPVFRVVPTHSDHPPTEVNGHDGTAVLSVMERLSIRECDVFLEGKYGYSISVQLGGAWYIFLRQKDEI